MTICTISLRYQIASPVEGWNVTIHGLDNERKEKFLNKFPKFQQKTEDVAVFLGPEEEPTFRHGSWQNDEPILHIISVSFLNTLAFLGFQVKDCISKRDNQTGKTTMWTLELQ